MIVSPSIISSYLQCPRKGFCTAQIEEEINPRALYLSKAGLIVSNVIVKSFVTQMRNVRIVGWKSIIVSMNTEVARVYREGEEQPKYVLSRLHSWYNSIYISDLGRTIPVVPVYFPLAYGLEYQDHIDLLRVQDRIELIDFRELSIQGSSYNSHYVLKQDWFIAVRLWGFLKTIQKLKPTHYSRLIIRDQTVIKQTMELEDPPLSRLSEEVILNAIHNIGAHLFTPAIGEQCVSCRFNPICKKEEWSFA